MGAQPPLVAGLCAFGLLGTVSTCGHEADRPASVASVRLTCWPVSRGLQCRLLALSTDVRQAPRDVTAEAAWHLRGLSGARITPRGLIEAPGDGEVTLVVEYQAKTARQMARLTRGGPGQLLWVLAGSAFALEERGLQPLAAVRIEITSGPNSGRSTLTGPDGAYELAGLAPGSLDLRASKAGYLPTEASLELGPGDRLIRVVMRPASRPPVGPHDHVAGSLHVIDRTRLT